MIGKRERYTVLLGLCLTTLGMACYAGLPGDKGPGVADSASAGGSTGDSSDEPRTDDGELADGESPMVRLIQAEFIETARAAFPSIAMPELELPSDASDGVFESNAGDRLADYGPYVGAAKTLGETIAAELAHECEWLEAPQACIDEHLAGPMQRAFRRPLTSGDTQLVAEMLGVLSQSELTITAEEGLAAAVGSIFMSPHFIYRPEWGGDDAGESGLVLSQYELAARLSYFLTDAPPDDELFAVAEQGGLDDPDVLADQAMRLFDSPAGEATTWRFASQWLALGRLEDRPLADDLTAELRAAMLEATRAFAMGIIYRGEGSFDDLFASNYSFINDTLAAHYGVEGDFGEDFTRVDWTAASGRQGILSHASVLSALATPDAELKTTMSRGRVIYSRLFCGELADPPPGATETEVEDRLEDSRCAGCHTLIEPPGAGLSQYDHLGRYDAGLSTQGAIAGTDVDGVFRGVEELNTALAQSAQVESCYLNLWFRYALERTPWEGDQDTIEQMRGALADGSTRDLIRMLVTSETFRLVNDPPLPSNESTCSDE